MRKALVSLCALAFLMSSACGNLFSPAAAVVDGKKITTDEVEEVLDQFFESDQYAQLAAQGDPKVIERQFEQIYLSRLVRRAVLTPRAADLGVVITDEAVDERVERIKSRYPSEEAFQAELEAQGLDLPLLRQFVTDRMLENRLREEITAGAAPTEEEVRAYYDDNIELYAETRVSHILLNDAERARELAERLQSAPAKRPTRLFKQLARRHSTDRQTKEEGGDLGYFTSGVHPGAFEDAVAEMEPGDISDPVPTELGFHVIYVMDRRTQPYEDVRDTIEELIGSPAEDAAWNEWIVDAYEDADVKVNPRYGELDLETQQIINASPENVPGTRPEASPTPGAGLLSPVPGP
jgi:parvulin-like peptidyl-prolyl isomerase